MRLARLRLVGIGPFADAELTLEGDVHDADDDGHANARLGLALAGTRRPLTVLFGASGVGKTALLATIASTRPGHALPPSPPPTVTSSARLSPAPGSEPNRVAYAVAEWALGIDDEARPHTLRVASPNAPVPPPGDGVDEALARRREQTAFDRRAVEGGFCLVAFSGARWFSRTPAVLTTPHRTYARFDVRAPSSFDDPTRTDLTRETKQALAYPVLGAALAQSSLTRVASDPSAPDAVAAALALDMALRGALAPLLALASVTFVGVDGATLEPVFDLFGARVSFDELPRAARHLASFAALTLRALHGAYPARDARTAEGVVLIDDVDVGLDLEATRALPKALRASFPHVQWILTTSSPAFALACAAGEVVALRRPDAVGPVAFHAGDDAVFH